jgi:hypothetical protein
MSEHSEEPEELSGELLSGNRKGEDEKELQRFRPQPAECSCCQGRVNHAIEKEGEDGHAVMTVNREAHVAAETVRAQS